MSTVTTAPPVITAWSAVSPYGIGARALVDGLRSGRPTAAPLPAGVWRTPDERVSLVPDFEPAAVLGKKGTRAMDRITGLAVTTVRDLLEQSGRSTSVATGEDGALVLGTAGGSVQSMMDFTRDGLVSEKPYFVDPARFPNAVMNCAAGQCAIWFQLKGPNTTIAAGRVSGLHALKYSQRLLASRRARTVLCGAVEEYSSARSWLEWHSVGPSEAGVPPGEGCVVLQLEPADEPGADELALADVLAVELGVFADGDLAPSLARCVRGALDRAGVAAGDLWAVSPNDPPGLLGGVEHAVLTDLLPDAHRIGLGGLIGETAGATAVFQIVALLARAGEAGSPGPRLAAVTAVDRDGQVGCAILRLR